MPSKGKSLVIAIISFAVFAYTVQSNSCFAYLYPLAAILTIVYGLTAIVKFTRDHGIAQRAMRERYVASDDFGAAAPPTTPGSGWIGLDPNPPESM